MMHIVWTHADIERLWQEGSLHPAYLAYASDLFQQLRRSLSDGEEHDDFSLTDHGPIVLLETGDDIRRLNGVGLDDKHGGLLGTWPEYVQTANLGQIVVYQILLLYDNEWGPIFLSVRDQLDDEAEAWLKDWAE